MKIIFLLALTSFAHANDYYSVARLKNATIIARSLVTDLRYEKIRIGMDDGRILPICRHDNASLAKFICRDPKSPYTFIINDSKTLFQSAGVIISEEGEAQVVRCYDGVTYGSLGCFREWPAI